MNGWVDHLLILQVFSLIGLIATRDSFTVACVVAATFRFGECRNAYAPWGAGQGFS